MSKQKYTIENFASTVMILILIGFIATNGLNQLISENSQQRQARANAITWQRLEQQQARFEVRQARATQLFNGIKYAVLFLLNAGLLLVLVMATGAVIFYLFRLARKSTQAYFEWSEVSQFELKRERMLEREYTKRVKFSQAKGVFDGLSLSGSLSYSPRDSHDVSSSYTPHFKAPKGITSGISDREFNQLVQDTEFSPVMQIPTFDKVLEDSKANNSNAFIVGYDEQGNEHWSQPKDFFSTSYGGLSRSGKTSLCVGLTALFVAKNPDTKLICIDPHYGTEDSLGIKLQPLQASFLMPVASNAQEIMQACKLVKSIFENRKQSNDTQQPYILVLIDEWTAVLRQDAELKEVLEMLAECLAMQTAKYKIIGSFLSQNWKAARSTGLKDVVQSHIVCRTNWKAFSNQTGLLSAEVDKATKSGIKTLERGEYMFLDTSGEIQKLKAPYCGEGDLQTVAEIVTAPKQARNIDETRAPIGFASDVLKHDETPMKHGCESTQAPSQTQIQALNFSDSQKHIYLLLSQGLSTTEISRQISGAKSGAKYQKALQEVNEVIQILVKGNQVNS